MTIVVAIVKPILLPQVMTIVGTAVALTGMMEMVTKTKTIALMKVLTMVMSMVVMILTAKETGYR